MFREMKKKNPHTININYTLEKEISMKKMEFLFKRVLFIYLFFFTRFTYFNTVAQTFYILINSQEVSRKSRVSCTSILNLFFFFLNVPCSNCVCFLFYMVHFSTFLFSWCASIARRESQMYLFEFIIFVQRILICHNITRIDTLFFLIYTYALEISNKVRNLYIYPISNCIIDCEIYSRRLNIQNAQKLTKYRR